MGGLVAEVSGQDFMTGAIAAGANAAVIAQLDGLMNGLNPEVRDALLSTSSQFVGMIAVAIQNPNADVSTLLAAGNIANTATQYNYLNHRQQMTMAEALDACKGNEQCQQNIFAKYKPLADEQNKFSLAEQLQYEQAAQVLTDKMIAECNTAACISQVQGRMQFNTLACGSIGCLKELSYTTMIGVGIDQGNAGTLILNALNDSPAVGAVLGPTRIGVSAAEALGNTSKYIGGMVDNVIDGLLGKGKAAQKLTGSLTAEAANAPHIAKGYAAPYAEGTVARDIILQEERLFVRVHGENNQARSWMMRPDEIKGLTPQQIQNKFALPEVPTFVSDVYVPAGTQIRVGTVAPQPGWGQGGAIQYELLERLPESAFKNMRQLP